MSLTPNNSYVEEGIDALSILTPLIEKRRWIIGGATLIALAVGAVTAAMPRKYKAELSLTPVVNNKSTTALGGIAALAGATLNTGYQLTPGRMVELLKSRTVLAGVGKSRVSDKSPETIIDRFLGEKYDRGDDEEIQKHIERVLTTTTNKETGTITVSVLHKDSLLSRLIASRVVDSASQIFVRTSKAQAQQLRIAQERRVAVAQDQLIAADQHLRDFNFANRVAPAFSVASMEREKLTREKDLAEQVYTQAAAEREAAVGRELEATPTVVVQDPLPPVLPKVRKRVIVKTFIAGFASLVLLSIGTLLAESTRRRLSRSDSVADRFRRAVSGLPRMKRTSARS